MRRSSLYGCWQKIQSCIEHFGARSGTHLHLQACNAPATTSESLSRINLSTRFTHHRSHLLSLSHHRIYMQGFTHLLLITNWSLSSHQHFLVNSRHRQTDLSPGQCLFISSVVRLLPCSSQVPELLHHLLHHLPRQLLHPALFTERSSLISIFQLDPSARPSTPRSIHPIPSQTRHLHPSTSVLITSTDSSKALHCRVRHQTKVLIF